MSAKGRFKPRGPDYDVSIPVGELSPEKKAAGVKQKWSVIGAAWRDTDTGRVQVKLDSMPFSGVIYLFPKDEEEP